MKVLLIFLISIIEGLLWFNIVSLFLEKNGRKIVNIALCMGLSILVFLKTIVLEADALQFVRSMFPILTFGYVICVVFKFFEGTIINKLFGTISYVIALQYKKQEVLSWRKQQH